MDNNLMMMPTGTIESVIARRNLMVDFVKQAMTRDVDYGIIPGTQKNTLLKPGAEKLNTLFGLAPRFIEVKSVEDWTGADHNGEPFFYYWQKCQLLRDGVIVGEGDGSCNSWEKKYRFRSSERLCPNCGKPAIIKGKEEYGGGWLCFEKKGGCKSKFKIDDPAIADQVTGQVANPEIADQVNTLLKMAQKRALIAATLLAVNASEFFTQDLEDMYIEATYRDVTEPTAEQRAELEHHAEAVGKQMAEERTAARAPRPGAYSRTHPPLSPVQRNKLLELTRLVHGEINTEMKLEALFMEQFQHGSDTATYEDGARLTGFLLAEIRKGKNAQPQEPNIAPLPDKVHVPSHEGNGNGAHTQEDFVALVKSSKIKNAGDIVKQHTAGNVTDWNAAFAELETHVKALA